MLCSLQAGKGICVLVSLLCADVTTFGLIGSNTFVFNVLSSLLVKPLLSATIHHKLASDQFDLDNAEDTCSMVTHTVLQSQ